MARRPSCSISASHSDYHRWASLRLPDAASSLPDGKLNRDFATADRTWLARLEERTPPAFVTSEDHGLHVVENEWPKRSLVAVGGGRGYPWRHPVWKLVTHVVNHGTHHRGQISGFLRSMGHTPPNVDLLRYIRDTDH